jgi:hypothetical protein
MNVPLDVPQELLDLLEALEHPLTPEDIAGGWDESGVSLAKRIAAGAANDLRSGNIPDASYHFVRWLDHHGVIGGSLLGIVSRAQMALPVA